MTYHQETRDPQLACIFLLPDLGIGKQHSKFIREDPFGPTGVLLWIAIYIMDSKVVDFDISAQFEASKVRCVPLELQPLQHRIIGPVVDRIVVIPTQRLR